MDRIILLDDFFKDYSLLEPYENEKKDVDLIIDFKNTKIIQSLYISIILKLYKSNEKRKIILDNTTNRIKLIIRKMLNIKLENLKIKVVEHDKY